MHGVKAQSCAIIAVIFETTYLIFLISPKLLILKANTPDFRFS